jgi:multiple sugar transport system ATP-binding protein
VLGIRPEDLRLGHGAESGPGLEAEIEVAETMGAETYLYLRLAGLPCVARVRSEEGWAPAQRIRISLDLARARLFDAQTELAL